MVNFEKILFENRDEQYAKFEANLTPTLPPESFIGVRVPKIREIAKQYKNTKDAEDFIKVLPHKYCDENILHGLIVSEIKDYNTAIKEINRFLPYVDNWMVCDITSPKCFKKNKDLLINDIKKWVNSKHGYTKRFGIEMMMSHFLDEDFKKEYLDIIASVKSNDEYYVQMMIAWFFATALFKQYNFSIKYIEDKKLEKWIHNKTIQKAKESYRITDEQKAYLNSLKY